MHREPNGATPRRILVIMGSDRYDDNVMLMARAALRGAIAADCYANLRILPEIIPDNLVRCSQCDGTKACRIRDGLEHFIRRDLEQADGIVLCSRVTAEGHTRDMEAFVQRSLCYREHHPSPIRFGNGHRPTPMALSLLLENTPLDSLKSIDVRMIDYARRMGGYMSKILVSQVPGSELGVERDYRASLKAVQQMSRYLLYTDPREFDMEFVNCPPKNHDHRYAFGAWGSLPDIH